MNFVKSSRMFGSMPQLDTPKKIQAERKDDKKTKNTLKESIYRSLKLFQNKEASRKESINEETPNDGMLDVNGVRHLSDSLDYRQVKSSGISDTTRIGSTGSINRISYTDGEDEHSLIYRPISYCSLPDLTEIDVFPRQKHLTRQRSRSLDCADQKSETSDLTETDVFPHQKHLTRQRSRSLDCADQRSETSELSLRVHNIHHDVIPIKEEASCSLPDLTDISHCNNEDVDMDRPSSVYDWDRAQNQVKGTKSLVKRFIGRMRAHTFGTRTKYRRRNEPGFTRSEGANVTRERIFIPLKS